MTVAAAVPILRDDLGQIAQWASQRGLMADPDGWLPPTGYWVPGVLAAWMYRTDAQVALIDNVIANPMTEAEERRLAMHAVSEAIADQARREGFRWLRGLTAYGSVAKNGAEAGYLVSEPKYMTMMLVLEEGAARGDA